jgi:hypothetical protein
MAAPTVSPQSLDEALLREAAKRAASQRLGLRPATYEPQPPDQRQQALTALRILYTDRLREAA